MKNIARVAVIGALLSTAACSDMQMAEFGSKPKGGPESSAAKQIDDRLSQAAERAAAANETLAQVERTRTAPTDPSMDGEAIASMPPELQRPTSVEWTGPAPQLVEELARNIGYTFSVIGKEPPVDIMVAVSAVDEPAIKVFEDIGYQVSQFAEVFVDPNGKRIEFRFLTNAHADDTPSAKAIAPAHKSPSLNHRQAANTPPAVRKHKEKLGK